MKYMIIVTGFFRPDLQIRVGIWRKDKIDGVSIEVRDGKIQRLNNELNKHNGTRLAGDNFAFCISIAFFSCIKN